MKKIIGALALSACFSVFAEDSPQELPEGGIYAGIGLENTEDKNDWQVKSVTLGETHYISENFSKNNRYFSGQLFMGYKNYCPFFYAVELVIGLKNKSFDKSFDYRENGEGPFMCPSHLRIENGHSVSAVLKLGKTIRSNITPYIMVGLCSRKTSFYFDYVPGDRAFLGGNPALDDALRASGIRKSCFSTKFVYGLGVALRLERGAEIRAEYCYKSQGAIKYQTVIDTTHIDQEGYPRHFYLKSSSKSLSIGISKNI